MRSRTGRNVVVATALWAVVLTKTANYVNRPQAGGYRPDRARPSIPIIDRSLAYRAVPDSPRRRRGPVRRDVIPRPPQELVRG